MPILVLFLLLEIPFPSLLEKNSLGCSSGSLLTSTPTCFRDGDVPFPHSTLPNLHSGEVPNPLAHSNSPLPDGNSFP